MNALLRIQTQVQIFCACTLVMALALCSTHCASVEAPSGGPRDSTAPVVLSTVPPAKSLNQHPEFIELQFSKYINKTQFAQNLFLTPSVRTQLSWSGRWLYVSFAEPLDSNITVALTLGTQYTDWQGNKPKSAFSLVFATGNRLDSGVIRGKVESLSADGKVEGAMVFLYALHGIHADTLNPQHTKPKYRTQVASDGAFEFQALAQGAYRLFAVKDEFRNDLIDENDGFGAATCDIALAEGSTATVTFRIAPPKDRTPPKIFDVQALSRSHVRVRFSEKLDTASVVPSAFRLSDSASGTAVPVVAAHLGAVGGVDNASVVELYTLEALSVLKRWRLLASVRDSAGNSMAPLPDSLKTAYFRASDEADTLQPRLVRVLIQPAPEGKTGADSAKEVSLKASIDAVFTMPMDSASAHNALLLTRSAAAPSLASTSLASPSLASPSLASPSLASTSAAVSMATVATTLRLKAANILTLTPREPLTGALWHRYLLKLANLRTLSSLTEELRALPMAEVATDSVFSRTFQTEDVRGYGGVSGVVHDSLRSSLKSSSEASLNDSARRSATKDSASGGAYIVLLTAKDAPLRRFHLVLPRTASGKVAWAFQDVPPGTYRLSAWFDANGDGEYGTGSPYPFAPSERYGVLSTELVIRPRWTVENVQVTIP